MANKFKIQHGIEFLQIVLSELRDPQVLNMEQHPGLKDMYRNMQDPDFDAATESFGYREKHFPSFMKDLYKKSAELPKEFEDYSDNDMIFGLVSSFIHQAVMAKSLEDIITRPKSHEKAYLSFCFQFFNAMEDKQIGEIAKREGVELTGPAVLEVKADGELGIVTGEGLLERKKNQKTDIESWNPFGNDNIEDMNEVCRKKGEIEVINNLQET